MTARWCATVRQRVRPGGTAARPMEETHACTGHSATTTRPGLRLDLGRHPRDRQRLGRFGVRQVHRDHGDGVDRRVRPAHAARDRAAAEGQSAARRSRAYHRLPADLARARRREHRRRRVRGVHARPRPEGLPRVPRLEGQAGSHPVQREGGGVQGIRPGVQELPGRREGVLADPEEEPASPSRRAPVCLRCPFRASPASPAPDPAEALSAAPSEAPASCPASTRRRGTGKRAHPADPRSPA